MAFSQSLYSMLRSIPAYLILWSSNASVINGKLIWLLLELQHIVSSCYRVTSNNWYCWISTFWEKLGRSAHLFPYSIIFRSYKFINLYCFSVPHPRHKNYGPMWKHEKFSLLPQHISLQDLGVSSCCQSPCQCTLMHLILPGYQGWMPESKEGPM